MTPSRLMTVTLGCSLCLLAASIGTAQIKTLPGERQTITARVEAIEKASRTVTLRDSKGELHDVIVPNGVERFSSIKIGDQVTVTYYDNVTLRKKDAGEPDVDTLHDAATPTPGSRPAGTAAVQRAITATIDAIDMKVPSISLKGPRGWAYSTKVKDKDALAKVKVGDRIDITWTEVMLVSMSPAGK